MLTGPSFKPDQGLTHDLETGSKVLIYEILGAKVSYPIHKNNHNNPILY